MWRLILLAAVGAAAALSVQAALPPRGALFVQGPLLSSKILNVSCASNDTCSTYNTRSVCVTSNETQGLAMQCVCALPVYPYPDTTNDICQQWAGGASDPCISSLDCWRDTNLICNDTAGVETSSCACPAAKPNFYGDSCYLDVVDYETDQCTSDAQCQAAFGEHTTCGAAINATGSVCRCRDTALFVSDACWLQHGLHEPCTETHECGTAFSACEDGECRCQAGWTEQAEPRTQQLVCVGGAAAAAAGPLLALLSLVAAIRRL